MAHITAELQYGGAAALGVLSHVAYFIHGTHHGRQSARIALCYLVAGVAILALSISALGLRNGAIHALLFSSAYVVALFTSMVSYRLYFHRIRHFPGPLAAKTTKLYAAYLNRNGKMHMEHLALSERYGDFVRVGPNELMIRHIDAIAAVHGAQSRCTKGPVYDNLEFMGEFNLDGMQDRESHRWRRQIWDRGLGSKSLEVYEVLVRETARDWLAKLAECAEEARSVDISLFSLLIAFENMGRVGFSKVWGGVRAGKESRLLYLIEFLFGQIAALGSSLNWPVPLAKAVNLDSRQAEFEALVMKTTDERLEVSSTMPHMTCQWKAC